MRSLRPTILEIDLSNIAHNVKELKKYAGKAELMAVVKANAYGHGVVPVARIAIEQGASWLGVATVGEGIELRKAGFLEPILILGGILPEESQLCKEYELDVTVSSRFFLKRLIDLSADSGILNVHLKIDTGMHRLGIIPRETASVAKMLAENGKIKVRGIWTHFPIAASQDRSFSENQINQFEECVKQVECIIGEIPYKHTANSAGVINLFQSHFNLVRPGLGLYGYHDEPHLAEKINLKPAMSWRTKITSLREVPKEEGVSYGLTYVTKRKTKVATLPVGYADGYNRLLSNRGEVLVRGKRAKIIGRVCMDQTMIDVTDIKGVEEGDDVILLGRQGQEFISIYEMCEWLGTIPNEILTTISVRVPRLYK